MFMMRFSKLSIMNGEGRSVRALVKLLSCGDALWVYKRVVLLHAPLEQV